MRELVRFGLVGASGAMVNLVAFALLTTALPPLVATPLSFELALLGNFLLNHHWTFAAAQRTSSLRALGRYQLASLGGLAINLLVVHALVEAQALPLVANALGIVAAMACNFALSIGWTWRTATPGLTPA